MKQKITYKQRLIYVLIAGALFIIILYNMAIADTVNLAVENNHIQQQIVTHQNAPQQIQLIQQKLKTIEQLIGNESYEGIDAHQLLLESVTSYAQQNELILKDFTKPYVLISKGYITKTTKITVEAGFIRILKLVHFLEKNNKLGKVVAVDFKAKKVIRTKKRRLNATIYLQNVKAQHHEKNN